MHRKLDHEVRRRARGICEYCHLPESISDLRHVVDHIVARQHKGRTVSANLALACGRCNRHKGPNIAGIDPRTRRLVPLFNPRTDRWADHFRWKSARLVGLTDVGRATIEILAINHPYRLAARRVLIESGILRLQ